jgi:hypothetical protein
MTGLSLEVLCAIADTPRSRLDIPGPGESPDLLRRYLQQEPYADLTDAGYQAVMEDAVRMWPQSHYAHAGLAYALLADHDTQGDPAKRRRAADELLTAAKIAFSEGKVLYVTHLPDLLADLTDGDALDDYFQRVFKLLPEGTDRYAGYLYYALALAKLGDERAEPFFQKAIEHSPEGIWEAYEGYTCYLLENGKAQAALDLLAPIPKRSTPPLKTSFTTRAVKPWSR